MYKYNLLPQYRLIDELAEIVLAKYKDRVDINIGPPVPVNDISEKLLSLHFEPHNLCQPKSGIEGALLKDEGVIIINEQCGNESTKYRNRWTIAHEIGHYVLPDIGDGEPSTVVLYGLKNRKDLERKAELREQAANKFANALLMPRSLMLSEIRKYKVINVKAVEKLAEVFNVSINAMLNRIEYLMKSLELEKEGIKTDIDALIFLRTRLKLVSYRGGKSIGHTKKSSVKKCPPKQQVFSDFAPFYPEENQPEVIRVVKRILIQRGLVGEARGDSPLKVLKKPFVIEFAGTPNSGKDTQIEIVSDYLRDIRGYKVKVVDEGYRDFMVNNNPKYRPYYMIGRNFINLVEIEYNPHGYDVFIINRALFDNLAFLHLYYDQGHISKKELITHAASLRLKNLTNLEDIVFLITISAEESLRRENNYPGKAIAALTKELDPSSPSEPNKSLVNSDGLALLNECYERAYTEYQNSFYIHRLYNYDHMEVEGVSLDLMKQVHSSLPKIPSQKPVLLRKLNLEQKSKDNLEDTSQPQLPGF